MPDQQFRARIAGARIRPPNVRPDEGGPRITLILDVAAKDLDLDQLMTRVTTNADKMVETHVHWEQEPEMPEQTPLRGMVECGPHAKRDGLWQCTDQPGRHLLAPCKHWLEMEANNHGTPPEARPTATDSPTEQAEQTSPGAITPDKTKIVNCYSTRHPAIAHQLTTLCLDPYAPTEEEFVIYQGDPDRAEENFPSFERNPIVCLYNPDAGWTCRTQPAPLTDPCIHVTSDQLDWARAAGWTPSQLAEAAATVTADLDRVELQEQERQTRQQTPNGTNPRPPRAKATV